MSPLLGPINRKAPRALTFVGGNAGLLELRENAADFDRRARVGSLSDLSLLSDDLRLDRSGAPDENTRNSADCGRRIVGMQFAEVTAPRCTLVSHRVSVTYRKVAVARKLSVALFFTLFSAVAAQRAWAIPVLQLGIIGGSYDSASETTISAWWWRSPSARNVRL